MLGWQCAPSKAPGTKNTESGESAITEAQSTPSEGFSDSQRRRGLIAVMVGAATIGLTIGLTIPLIALNMAAAGAGGMLIGINAGMPALAVLAMAPLAPRLIGWIGMVPAVVLGCVVSAAALALFPLVESLPVWFALRFAVGFGLAIQWVVGETWLSRIATSETRGRVVGCYATLWSVGIAAGPLLLDVTGIIGLVPFFTAATLVLCAALPAVVARASVPAKPAGGGEGQWSWALFRVAPVAIFAGFTTGFSEVSLFTLIPLYGQGGGMTPSSAVLMVSALAVGGVVWQLPLGWLADRLGSARVLIAAAVVSLAAAVTLDMAVGALPSVAAWTMVWPVLFLWGGTMSSFYTLGLTQVGERFSVAHLGHANVLFIMAYTVGTIGGPMISGAALDLWPTHGLPLVLAALYCGYLTVALLTDA